MIYLGDYPTGATVYVPFNTFSSVGASITITGLAVTDIEIYKDGSATQRASDAGYTLLDTDGIDFDSITGVHGFSIDLSDNTDAGFYAAGHEYWVVVSSITCDSQTVSFIAATFSIERAGGALALLKSATYGLSALKSILDTSGVVLGSTQGAITWAQQKIVANVANQGALDIRNANANGIGTYNQGGDVGLYNDGTALYGQYNVGADTGLYNNGTGAGAYGNYNAGVAIGQYNAASGAASIGQTNQGVADGQYNNGTGAAGIGSKNEGTIYGMQATGGTADTDPAISGSATVFPTGAIEFTYTVTDSSTGLPLEGVEVWISTDNPAVNIVWKGDTDAFGIAMDVLGNKPKLDPGTYYFWRQLAGFTFTDPDSEVVS